MKKKILFSGSILLLLLLLLGFLAATKMGQFRAMKEAGEEGGPPPDTVAVTEVKADTWDRRLRSVGSVEPVQGVTLEAEVPGIVREINFENGQFVEEGRLLFKLDVEVLEAELREARASRTLAEIEYERAKRLRETDNIPQSELDRASADLERAEARIDNIRAEIRRKTVYAPFSGRVGIRRANLGRYVNSGEPLVNIQSDEKVHVGFSLPQRNLHAISEGLDLVVTTDAFPDRRFEGTLTAINPRVDSQTRSVELQGTFDNGDGLLRTGLFVRVQMILEGEDDVITVPATAIQHAPYGDSVYVVTERENADSDEPAHRAKQKFVRAGRTRGDFVNILEGLSPGERVVSAGAFKLDADSPVRINNELAPDPKENPRPENR